MAVYADLEASRMARNCPLTLASRRPKLHALETITQESVDVLSWKAASRINRVRWFLQQPHKTLHSSQILPKSCVRPSF
jgi:hypothetical protein